ncbi:MAG: hypothetical protein IKF75_06645, partial [Lachnospiraceae bacterium]|nr:hypothetical protein [Lachnospiraceae bacterium]
QSLLREYYVKMGVSPEVCNYCSTVEEKLKDGMVLILQDDYADNEAFTTAEKILDEGAYEYRTETKK